MSEDFKMKNTVGYDNLRHEYGHTKQLDKLGIVKYTAFIFIPSASTDGLDPNYYNYPWEVTADKYGEVNSRNAKWYWKLIGDLYMEIIDRI